MEEVLNIPDLSEVEAWTGLEPGTYQARVADAKIGRSRSNHPELELAFQIGRQAEDGVTEFRPGGGTITDWIAVTEKSLGRVRALTDALQLPPSIGTLQRSALIGQRATIRVGHHPTPDGGQVLRVKGYALPEGDARVVEAADRSGGDDIPF